MNAAIETEKNLLENPLSIIQSNFDFLWRVFLKKKCQRLLRGGVNETWHHNNITNVLHQSCRRSFKFKAIVFLQFYGFLFAVCTPIGFIRLFSVVGQVLVKPTLLRDVNEEFQTFNMEEASVKRKINSNKSKGYLGIFCRKFCLTFFKHILQYRNFSLEFSPPSDTDKLSSTPSKLCGNLDDLYLVKPASTNNKHEKSLLELQVNAVIGNNRKYFEQISYGKQKDSVENEKLYGRLRELEMERHELEKQRSSSCVSRNLIYPLAMLLLLLITSITVLLVMQNTIELLIGIKALPLSSRVSEKGEFEIRVEFFNFYKLLNFEHFKKKFIFYF